jgi:HEPN domain-containing protein
LEILLKECGKIEERLLNFTQEALELSDYYLEARYPIDADLNISRGEAKESLKKAEVIKDFVEELLEE